MPETAALYTTKCRGCGVPIHFVRRSNGKAMCCEVQERFVMPNDEGRDLLVNPKGEIIRGVLVSQDNDVPEGAEAGWISHHATCPKAGEFRKPKEVSHA